SLGFSDVFMNPTVQDQTSHRHGLAKFWLYMRKVTASLAVISEGFYLVFRHGLYKNPNNPTNTRYVQHFCRQLCKVFNIEVQVHAYFFWPKQKLKTGQFWVNWPKVAALYLSNVVLVIRCVSANRLPDF